MKAIPEKYHTNSGPYLLHFLPGLQGLIVCITCQTFSPSNNVIHPNNDYYNSKIKSDTVKQRLHVKKLNWWLLLRVLLSTKTEQVGLMWCCLHVTWIKVQSSNILVTSDSFVDPCNQHKIWQEYIEKDPQIAL